MNNPISLAKIARMVDGELHGDGHKMIAAAAAFETAGPEAITYAAGAAYLKRLDDTAAGAVLVSVVPEHAVGNLVRVDRPELAFARVMQYFYPLSRPAAGVHPSACIGTDLVCGDDVAIGPNAVIGDRVRLGDRVSIRAGAVVGDDTVIGEDADIMPNVTIADHCRIGKRVVIHSGSVIGSDGFGYVPDGETYVKIPHIGFVQIDDDVEIGACNTIDRGKLGKTWIQEGVKTDNLVHVAHNVTVGAHTVLVAQVGISGSVSIGRHAILAGQAGVAGHLTIGDHAIVGPQAGLAKSVADGETVSGSPGMPHRLWLRVHRVLPQLPEIKKTVDRIARRLKSLEDRREDDSPNPAPD